MALDERVENYELNEFQREKTGFELDVRYQSITSMLEPLELPLLQALKDKIDLIMNENAGS